MTSWSITPADGAAACADGRFRSKTVNPKGWSSLSSLGSRPRAESSLISRDVIIKVAGGNHRQDMFYASYFRLRGCGGPGVTAIAGAGADDDAMAARQWGDAADHRAELAVGKAMGRCWP